MKNTSNSDKNKHYIIAALARTGYHAIMQWVAKQMDGPVVFCNNINQDFESRRRCVYNCNVGTDNIDYLIEDERVPVNIIYSLENFDLRGYQDLFGEYDFEKIMIVVRDPYNWIASSLANGNHLAKLRKTWEPSELEYDKWFCQSMSRLDMYKQYMKEVTEQTNLIGEYFVEISYNHWFKDKRYRRALADDLNLEFSDEGIEEVARFGSGSSFSGYEYDGRATEMNVLERWKSMEKEVMEYMDEELEEYSRRFFFFNPFDRRR